MDWPENTGICSKTPTRFAYKRENPEVDDMEGDLWGFEVFPKLISCSWTKLLLDKKATVEKYDDPTLFSDMTTLGMMRLPSFRDAPGVCEDFLRKLFEHLTSLLRKEMTELIFANTPMECWITLPAIWSDEAKEATLQAAKKAGFGNRPGDEVFTIAEPEAAAIAALKKYAAADCLNPVKPNDNILILDCGGGTVDITTYKITHVEPRLDFEELCVGIGGKCGSTYIDRKLHGLLSQRFGSVFENVPWALKGPGSDFMNAFESIKRNFGNKKSRRVQELPIKLGIAKSRYYDEEERSVKLSYDDIKGLFDPVIKDITNLVEHQLQDVKKNKGDRIDRIILVGGFGSSPYLFNVLEEWCEQKGGITLMKPEHPESAIVRGAAIRGLEGIAPRMKRARRHYGFALSLDFREGIDPDATAYFDDFDGEKIFSDTFRTQDVEMAFTPGQPVISTMKLYSCGLNDPPEYHTNPRVDEVGCIEAYFDRDFDFGPNIRSTWSVKLGRMVYKFPHQVQVRFGDKGENLQFRILVQGRVISEAVIKFGQS
ncbi:Hsp70 family protein-like protein [Stipitochalara longipes BDJ]|nr:Hsp70 family protein-like protein [Stipitochalara longipes BDJ]